MWCASRNGCDEGGDFNGRYPYRGCELAHMPSHVPVQQWERGPLYSSISSGFITGTDLSGHDQQFSCQVAKTCGF